MSNDRSLSKKNRPCSVLLLAGVFLMGGLAASAQSSKKSGTPAEGSASEAWTGVITYTRTQNQSDHKTVERVSGRGKDTRNWEMKYDYKASIGVVESPEMNGQNVGKASITHSFVSKETNTAVEKNSCDRGKTWQEMTGTFTSETRISGQGKAEANVNIGINSDGTYSVSVGVPEIDGLLSGSESSTFSGQCTPKKGKNVALPASPTKIQGGSLTSDGSTRVDPKNPNALSGRYSLSLPGGVLETISWSLQRHTVPLRIVEVKFADMKYPKWDDWQEITEQTGTVDGNWVKIKAVVLNASSRTRTAEVRFKETYKGDKWDGARPDASLKDEVVSVTLEPGEEREVELVWDSNGYAWYDDGRPRLIQRLKAELWENSTKIDEKTGVLKLRPRPLVFVPGVWTDRVDFEIYQNLLTTTHSYDWKAMPMPAKPATIPVVVEGAPAPTEPTASNDSVYTHADNLNTYVNDVRSSLNAWHIDLMAHGTGGLDARLYIHKQMEVLTDGRPVVRHLLLLGTPNTALPCGILTIEREHREIARQLSAEEMELFNQYVTQRKGTKFSALAGNQLPILCDTPKWSDGYVPVEVVSYGIEDVTLSSVTHSGLLSVENFSNYVRAHVITGPLGTYPVAARNK